jgi:hypothetical protein
MVRRRLKALAARIRRCLVVGLALAGYLTSAVGFPVPVAASRDSSRPFPCQNHSCGCLTAEQCWQHCCCYTAEQKVAWAREHKVEPPAAVVAEAERGWSSPRQRDRLAAGPTRTEQCSCQGCGTHAARPQPAPSKPVATKTTKSTVWVSGVAAQQCRGLGNFWLGGTPVVQPPVPLTWSFEWTSVCWLQPAQDVACSLSSPPPPPPPRG